MAIRTFLTIAAITAFSVPVMAQDTPQQVQNGQVDCADPANAELEVCLDLPGTGVTNFVPLIAPVAGLLGLGALAGGGSTSSTTSTPSTTN